MRLRTAFRRFADVSVRSIALAMLLGFAPTLLAQSGPNDPAGASTGSPIVSIPATPLVAPNESSHRDAPAECPADGGNPPAEREPDRVGRPTPSPAPKPGVTVSADPNEPSTPQGSVPESVTEGRISEAETSRHERGRVTEGNGSNGEAVDVGRTPKSGERSASSSRPLPRTQSQPVSKSRPDAITEEQSRAIQAWLAEEKLSVELEEDREQNESPALRGLKRELLGSYRQQAKQRQILQLLNEYRGQREEYRDRGDQPSHRAAYERSTRRSYELYKGGSRIVRAEEPDTFDFWRFVLNGARTADDMATVRDAFRALYETFGEDPRFDGFLEDQRREILRHEEAHVE